MVNPSNKNNLFVSLAAIIIIGGVAGFGYQMYEHNSRAAHEISSIDIPDNQESTDKWIKYTGSNSCPMLVEQRFDANGSHYVCVYQR